MKTIALYHADAAYVKTLIHQFQACLPAHRLTAWAPQTPADYLITWKPDAKIFTTPGVKVLFALGAGVDAFLQADIPADLPIVRLEEAGMGAQMLEIVLYAILHYSRDMIALNQAQRRRQWLGESTPKKLPFSTSIGVMGLGQLGSYVATRLAKLGYPVNGYSRSLKQLDGVKCFDASGFSAFLARSEVLVNLLPLTPQTQDILNADLFAQLPHGAYVVNIARGKHLQEADLSAALGSGQLCGAFLDVFRTEPLPPNHPFWADERITITPHLAAITLQNEAVKQISANIIAYENGQAMRGVVDRQRGY